jgi:hypothetical protein
MSNESPPQVSIPDTPLDSSGFTASGKKHFKDVVESYSKDMFTKSISYAEGDRADGMSREVTHDHVKKAYFSVANSKGKNKKPGWTIFAQILEYVLMAVVGICGSNMKDPWGQIGFGIGLFAVAMLVFARNTLGKEEE